MAFKQSDIDSKEIIHDGAEALDYLSKSGKYTHHDLSNEPCVILLDLNLLKSSED